MVSFTRKNDLKYVKDVKRLYTNCRKLYTILRNKYLYLFYLIYLDDVMTNMTLAIPEEIEDTDKEISGIIITIIGVIK